MAPFPDNLPPYGLDTVTKLLIYFGILYILSTAFTTWLITRRRSFPKVEKKTTSNEAQVSTSSTDNFARGITETMSFDDTKDNLASLKIEIQGAEAALNQLQELKGELSPLAYDKLSSEYNSRVSELTVMMNDMLKSDIATNTGEVDEGITDDEMEAIEADLEQQLMDLDDDDFLVRKRPKKNIDELLGGTSPSKPAPSQPKATQPSQPKATPAAQASAPAPAPKEKKRVPMPPPPKKASTPTAATPAAQASTPTASTPKASESKKVPMPPPPKKGSSPPPTSGATAPKATPPAAQPPKSNQPLSAAQPMKVETEDDDGMFAKSTSIAALRMDMLRELARLKKLIPEDQDKDQ